MRKVGCEVARNGRSVNVAELYSAIVRNLCGCSTNDVSDSDWLAPTTRRLFACEHQEVLRVASHTGREVIQAEEVLQRVWIGLLTLEFVDELELAIEEVLVSATEANEGTGHVLAAKLRLASRKIYRSVLHSVERVGQLGELIIALNLEGGQFGKAFGGTSRLDHCRDAFLGSNTCLLRQFRDRSGNASSDRANRYESEEQCQEQQEANRNENDASLLFHRFGNIADLVKRLARYICRLIRLNYPIDLGSEAVALEIADRTDRTDHFFAGHCGGREVFVLGDIEHCGVETARRVGELTRAKDDHRVVVGRSVGDDYRGCDIDDAALDTSFFSELVEQAVEIIERNTYTHDCGAVDGCWFLHF